jgi:hypothetical protein
MMDDRPVCALCSKPVALGFSVVVDAGTVHLRCAVRATGMESLALHERARLTQRRAGELSDRARGLIAARQVASRSGATLQLWVGRVVAVDCARGRLTVGSQEFELAPELPVDDLQVGQSVRVLYDAAEGQHRVVEVRTLSG